MYTLITIMNQPKTVTITSYQERYNINHKAKESNVYPSTSSSPAVQMAINEQKPHFVLLPFMAQGHMIPMVDIARLLARRGVTITILTTPHNADRFKTVFARLFESELDIHVLNLKFPCVEAGLPEGCENFDLLPTVDDALKFFKAGSMLQDQVEELLRYLKPSCFIADLNYLWATDLALKLHIPRFVFHGMGCFSILCLHVQGTCKDLEAITSETEYFVMPGLPDRIEITKAQLRGSLLQWPSDWTEILEKMREAEGKAFGTVANTFEELELEYIKEYRKVKGKKVYCIGPVSLCNKDELDKAERGKKSSINEHHCLKWLESHETSSVLYVCLGSVSRLATPQLIELGLALEASTRPFVWVIRNASDELKKWILEEKFEGRIGNRGLLIHGWAPQMLILSHPSVGGFLTHCGWNSTLEGVTVGVPMITWPVFAEQFCNEKFIVSVIKTGIRVGVEVPIIFGDEEKVGVLVKNDEIRIVIDKLMDGGEEGEERRDRARKLGDMAKRAPEENGSSWSNLTMLIQDVIKQQENSEDQYENGVKLVEENSDELIVQ